MKTADITISAKPFSAREKIVENKVPPLGGILI